MIKNHVLLGWELGGGLGHARRLLTIAALLQTRGWSPVVAARDVWSAANEYRDAGISVVQAPRPPELEPALVVRSYADIMEANGYRHARWLLPVVLSWDHLIDLIRPGLIIADFSPTLMLAAYDRIPALGVGSGFALPPSHLAQMPILYRKASQLPDESALLTQAAIVQSHRRRAAPSTLPSLIAGQAHVVCTYQETDIYAQFRLQPATGPLDTSPAPLAEPDKTGVFAYLAAEFPPTAAVLNVLAASGFSVEVFLRNASDEVKSNLRALNVRVHDTPPRLQEVASRASIIVHHGGIGTIEASVALGRPQILLPSNFEQGLNASNLVIRGLAKEIKPTFSLAEVRATVNDAVSSKALAENARDMGVQLSTRPKPSLERIIALSETLASNGLY